MSKLVEIQAELKAPKSQRNTFGKYNYRSAEDILEAVKPLLKKHDAKIILSDKPILVGDWHYIEATAKFVCGDEVEVVTAYAREPLNKKGMDESQITGTASSYARKYALNGLLLIDDTKDADTDEHHRQTAGNNQKAFSKDDVTALRLDLVKLATATGKDVNELEKRVATAIDLDSFEAINNQHNFAKANALVKQAMVQAGV